MLALTLPGQLDWCKHGKELESGTDISVLSEVWAAWLRDPVPGQWSHASLSWVTHTHRVTAWQAISHSLPTSQTQNCCHHLSHSFTTTRYYGCELLSPHSSCSPWIPVFSWGMRKLSPLPSHTLCGHDQATRRRHHVIRLYFTYIGLLAWLVSGENIESIYWVLCAAIYQRQL